MVSWLDLLMIPPNCPRLVDERYGNVTAYMGRVVKREEVVELPPRELA